MKSVCIIALASTVGSVSALLSTAQLHGNSSLEAHVAQRTEDISQVVQLIRDGATAEARDMMVQNIDSTFSMLTAIENLKNQYPDGDDEAAVTSALAEFKFDLRDTLEAFEQTLEWLERRELAELDELTTPFLDDAEWVRVINQLNHDIQRRHRQHVDIVERFWSRA